MKNNLFLFVISLWISPIYCIANFFDHIQECMDNDRLEEALESYITINNKGVDASVINYDIAHISSMVGKHAQSLAYYEKAHAQEPNNTVYLFSYAKALLALGNFEKGLPLFEYRFADTAKTHAVYQYMGLKPQDFTGKSVVILSEWGYGDYMQFIRYVKLIREYHPKKILVHTFPQLVKLFSLCPYIDEVLSFEINPPVADLYVPYLSLPLIFKTTLETIPAPIPYLYTDPHLTAYWKNKIADDHHFKVGICWQAKKIFLEDHIHSRRSLPLSLMAELAQIPNVSLYSLQKGAGHEQLVTIPPSITIYDFDQELDQEHGCFMDTAALIKNLDLVISADTSIVHLAGALGKPVWVLLPHVAEWRWLSERTDTPWYPQTMRLFRQPKPGDWRSVIDEVKRALTVLIEEQQQ